MKVFVIGPDKAEIQGAINAALYAHQHTLVNFTLSATGARDKLESLHGSPLEPEVILVLADVLPRDGEAALLEKLSPWPVVMLVKHNRLSRLVAIQNLQQVQLHVRGVLTAPPYDFSGLDHLLAMPTTAATSAAAPNGVPVTRPPVVLTPNPDPEVRSTTPQPFKRQLRLGLYGSRGGVGVSTAVVRIAQALAASNRTVALFDSTRRGDLHWLLDQEPQAEVTSVGLIKIFLDAPTEDAARGVDAVLIDGGRRAGWFNADWLRLDKPLTDQEIERWVARPASPHVNRRLGRLLSIEVTE
jgi:hypothetical protein